MGFQPDLAKPARIGAMIALFPVFSPREAYGSLSASACSVRLLCACGGDPPACAFRRRPDAMSFGQGLGLRIGERERAAAVGETTLSEPSSLTDARVIVGTPGYCGRAGVRRPHRTAWGGGR